MAANGKVSSYLLGLQLLAMAMMLLLEKISAVEFQVGGSKGWGVPSDPNSQTLNQWAETRRFQIGDSLVFNYHADQDSVLQVNQDDYKNCNTESPIKKFSDDHTVFKFENSGPYYFISGNKDNCLKNEKLVVVVLADRNKKYSPPPPNSTNIAPSPPPTGEGSSFQPPVASADINPAPSPVSDEQPANAAPAAASSFIISFLGVTGSFATWAFLL